MNSSRANKNSDSMSLIILLVFAGIFYYYISNDILNYYGAGDQSFYRRFYNAIYGEYLENIVQLQKAHLGGSEPIFGLLMWVGANLEYDKDSYISFFNSIIAVLLIRWLILKRVHYIIIFLICTNFYLVTIMTSAERLKFSYLFLLILLNKDIYKTNNNEKQDNKSFDTYDIILLACMVLSHFQSIFMLLAYTALYHGKKLLFLRKYFTLGRLIIISIPFIIFGSYIFYYQWDSIMSKFQTYSSSEKNIYGGLIKALGIILIATYITSRKKPMLFMGGLMSCFIIILGGDRLNMILLCIILYALIDENKISHPVIFLLLSYFSYRSIGFIQNIYSYGDGFFTVDAQ